MNQMRDGLYMVQHGSITAAFVVRGGKVTSCAPVLRKNLDFFARKAKFVPTDTDIAPPVLEEAEV